MGREQREHSPPPARALWERVERERIARGWTTVQLAKEAGVDRKTHGRLKDSARSPLPETVHAFARTLNIPLEEAFILAGLDPAAAAVGETVEPESEPEPVDPLDDLLARVPAWRRRIWERVRAEERERYERQSATAREDYERALSRIEEVLKLEIEADRKSSEEGKEKD
ncbi:helix-turn-helix transcriptional regulator [Streptosporangium sp. NPDC051022]|uniref:helix-turn-helix transcriptional regulator n=1 Tax=Streptosporangium sp. NPDC051022 TaxID=3155752 RepID=UPI00343275FB